ncbi:MAG: hypothetical protein ACK4UJ_08940 [Leptonema sp. (in: bacteria)]
MYLISSDFPDIGKENPKKAYNDFVRVAIDLLEENQVNLNHMADLCPQEIQSDILRNREYDWHFLKKYNFFYYEPSYILGKSYLYWQEKKDFVLRAIEYLKKGQKYAIEIPAEITQEKKRILIPLLLDQAYNAICLPNESKKNWKKYIEFLENSAYRKILQNKDEVLPYPKEFDFNVLKALENDEKYIFAIHKYIGNWIPFEYISNCPKEKFVCSHLKEADFFYNKLAFVYPTMSLGNVFLNHGRVYLLLSKHEKNPKYLDLALDRYAGAKNYSESYVDAYIEMIFLFLEKEENNKALEIINEFQSIRPKRFPQETFYYDLIYKTLTRLGYTYEADCFHNNTIDTEECKIIRDQF